jgi:outer membrane protein TolC
MKIIYILLFTTLLYSSQSLSLDEALDILKENNLELKSATLEVNSAKAKVKTASGTNWGKLDFIQDFARSNDAGNVFGFKLTSREANFGDFGAEEFMDNFMGGNPDYVTPPDKLNYPGYRNFFQSKLKYEVPVFTGFKISSYTNIMKSMAKMKTLEKEKLMSEKKYELRKSFYDMALLRTSEKHLNVILTNISKLEDITQNMIDVGYAKKVDLLEVKAKKGNVKRLISQMKSNQKLLFHYISFLLDRKVEDIQTPSGDVDMPAFSDEEILNSNIDIKRAGTGLVIRKNMIDVEQSAYYPMVGAFGEVATADDDFFNNAGKHKAYTIGARLTWNIFNGGVDGANIEKSRINYLKTQTQLALAKSGIALKIQKIRTQIETSNSDIESLQIELELANEIYKNYEARYKEKLSSMSDVIIKQTEQIQKILQLQQARNKRNERIFALEKLANGDI